MKTVIAAAGRTPPDHRVEPAEPRPLPVKKVQNASLTLLPATSDSEDELFFDALDTQPWLVQEEPACWQWPLLNSLVVQIREALHYQLSMLSRTALASGMLNVIHPDLSKLLAAVLICHRQGQDILWQAGVVGGLELLNNFIGIVAGATSGAAVLSALPNLLIIWLGRQQISPATTTIETLSLLMATGLKICAGEDLAQPDWLVKLQQQVIVPAMRLGRESGITATLTVGITLMLGVYTMLRLTGCLKGKAPAPNALVHGIRIIQHICRLSDLSQHFQQGYEDKLIKSWYQRTYQQPYQPQKASKALERAVIRCMPKDKLLLRDARGKSTDRQGMDNAAREKFTLAYRQTERQILTGQLSQCTEVCRTLSTSHRYQVTGSTADLMPERVASSTERGATSAPLLVSGAMVAGMAVQNAWWHGRTAWSLAATGATLLTVAGIRHAIAHLPALAADSADRSLCLTTTLKVRQLLRSEKSGIRLAVELFDYLYDDSGGLDVSNANDLLQTWKITTFTSSDYQQMNYLITDILSLLLAPANSNEPMDIKGIIIGLGHRVTIIWLYLIEHKKNSSIKSVLSQLRKYCASEYFTLEIYNRREMKKITDFLLSQTAPDLLFFERNGRSEEELISKYTFYIWSYLSRQISANRDFRHDKFSVAIKEGRLDVFSLTRLRSYHSWNNTATQKMLEDSYKEVNHEMYNYHKSDIKLESTIACTLDDIIEAEYFEIDIHKRILFESDYISIHSKIPYGNKARALFSCETYRDIIRSFEDGFAILYQYLPGKIPTSLREYKVDDKSSFTLKKHSTLSELYKKFDMAYQIMTEQYCEQYNITVKNAFKILPDDDERFLKDPYTQLFTVSFEIKRFALFRYIFAPKTFRMTERSVNHHFYNDRPYHENGKFFTAYNRFSKERRFYHIHIYDSREDPQQLPVRRLAINSIEEIMNLDPALLDKHFIFLDEKPLFESCGKTSPLINTLFSRWDKTGEYLTENYNYLKYKFCITFQKPEEIMVTFQETLLGDKNTTPLEALTKIMTEDCKRQLNHKQAKAYNPTEAEQEKARGELQRIISYVPFYECYHLIKDHIISTVDDSPAELKIPVLGLAICISDFYLGYGVKKALFSMLKSIKKKSAAVWLRKTNLKQFQNELSKTPGTSRGHPQSVLDRISQENEQIRLLDLEIASLQENIHKTMGDVVSVPIFIAIPWMSVTSKKDFLVAHVPWAVNKVKTFITHLYEMQKNDFSPPQWDNATARRAVENEKFTLPQPAANNLTCYTEASQPANILFDVFDLRYSAPALYHRLFFIALREPTPNTLTTIIENSGWVIRGNYYQNKIISFISLTNLVRHLTDMILAQEDYYKPGKNDIKITEEALYQYYSDFLERPYITLPVELHTVQYDLVVQSIKTIRAVLSSNIEGLELNYLFMIQYFLLKEETHILLQAMNTDPQEAQYAQNLMRQNLVLSMSRFTIYGNSHSLVKTNFLSSLINKFIQYFTDIISTNPSYITLFSANTEIFLERQQHYHHRHPNATVPSPAVFSASWLQLAKYINDIYQSFARIEYSAKVLSEFPTAQWYNEDALMAWRAALQHYLFPEMQYENLTPLLRYAAEELAGYWQEYQATANVKPEIIRNSDLHPLFLTQVSNALSKSCARYPGLFFSQVYQLDNGYWFTFLTNDFLFPIRRLPRHPRQLHSAYPSSPLAPLRPPTLEESVILPIRQRLTIAKPELYVDNPTLYQQQLRAVSASFAQFAAHPFHQRLYGHTLEDFTLPESDTVQQTASLINCLIDKQGEFVDYQLRVLSHYLPQVNEADNYLLLQLLSDMLRMAAPQAPALYQFIFHHLQQQLAQPQVRLSLLCHESFAGGQLTEIYRRYLPAIPHADADTQQALRRYITATLRHLLSFTSYLTHVEFLLAAAPMQSLPVQWLCIGAIIAHQLRVPTLSSGKLLQLAQAAIADAGLLSFSDTAIQQTALIGGHVTQPGPRREVHDALRVVATGVQQAAEMQQQVLDCLAINRQLRGSLSRLTLSGLTAEQGQQLSTLLVSAVDKQRKLLQPALLQLPGYRDPSLPLKKQQLRIRWHPAWHNNRQSLKVVGLALYINDQQGFLLPLGDPQLIPLFFRQLPRDPSANQLAKLCFGVSGKNQTLSESVELELTVGQGVGDPLSVISMRLRSEITTRLSPLMQADNDPAFNQLKQQLEQWLDRHLLFYGQGDEGDDDNSLQEQAEQLAMLANHPTLQSWLQPDNTAKNNESAVAQFSRAITGVMGARTGWPTLADNLRAPPQKTGPVLLTSLPASRFAGFWWDPVSHFCYLGWMAGVQRTLYASISEDRHHLYPLLDDAASAGITRQLISYDWLRQSLQALQRGTLSAERFFSYSIPLAWRLQCAMAETSPLPATALPRPGSPGVYISGSGESRRHYYSPGGAHQALPVTLTELNGAGYRLEFSPSAAGASPDLAFTLEIKPEDGSRPDQGLFIMSRPWQLASATRASRLVAEGNFSPAAYLQWISPLSAATMMPVSRVLQRTDGSLVFIFGEHNFRRVSYRIPDREGRLQPSPTIPADWPRNINASNEQQFNAAIDHFFLRQNAPDYWLFPQPEDQQRAGAELSGIRQNSRTMMTTIAAMMHSLPFRFAINEEVQDELFHINMYLRGQGRHLSDEIKKRADLEQSAITLDDLLYKLLDWRQSNLSQLLARAEALKSIALKKRLLDNLLTLLSDEHELDYRSPALQQWVQRSLDVLAQAQSAMTFFQASPPRQPTAEDTLRRIQQQRFAQNYFFGYYNEQLHATADFFQQPWQCVRDNGGLPPHWQTALDQLHTLTSGLPADMRELDRLLTLPEALWQTTEMQQRAQHWQRLCHNASDYWQIPHHAEQIILLRPKASQQGLHYIPQKYRWPVRLILTAGTGHPIGNQDEGTAAPLQISWEQNDDLLLTRSGPDATDAAVIPLAGIAVHPRDARGFAEWAKLRLSSPWALAEYSGPAFLERLQQRIQQVTQQESEGWSQEERDFYRSADTRRFLREEPEEQTDRQQYLAFFRQLYNSNLLVTRLIMTDAEMVFGLLCDRFLEQYPDRAAEELSAAWFLFMQLFDYSDEGEQHPPLWLLGI